MEEFSLMLIPTWQISIDSLNGGEKEYFYSCNNLPSNYLYIELEYSYL